MKSILVIMLLGISASLSAQPTPTTYYTKTVNTAHLNRSSNTWIWGNKTEVSMQITLAGKRVYIDNKGQTKLTLLGDYREKRVFLDGGGGTKYISQAIDEDGDECEFSLIIWDGDFYNQVYLEYPMVKACYTLSPN